MRIYSQSRTLLEDHVIGSCCSQSPISPSSSWLFCVDPNIIGLALKKNIPEAGKLLSMILIFLLGAHQNLQDVLVIYLQISHSISFLTNPEKI